MVKLSPKNLLSSSEITFSNVKVNAYSRSFEDEINSYGKATLLEVFTDMLFIREFENTLKLSRDSGLLGYKFSYPSHLSIGQEAVAVGQALALKKEDIVFGSHRAHGEFLAKSFRAIRLSEENELLSVFENYPTATYNAIKDKLQGSIKEKALTFLLYGAFSEIFARSTGLQRGLGGSMHLHFMPFGSYPNNAIVGGSAPIAVGSALYDRINGDGRLNVVNVGDGALNCGAVYESIAFATMNQYKGLWASKKGLPLLFVVIDNLYARGGNTKLETGSYDNPARVSVGFTSDQMRSESVNGLNPFAVADAVKRHRQDVLLGNGASLINCTTYRHDEHSIGDKPNRDESEVASWKALDPIATYSRLLIENNLLTKDELDALHAEVRKKTMLAYSFAIDENLSPAVDLKTDENAISKYVFNNETMAKESVSSPLENSPLYLDLKNKSPESFTLRDAVSLGIMEGYIGYSKFICYGEDVRGWQSKNSVFYGLDKYLPYEKLFNAPIAESAIVGSEIGYALRGGNVLSELLYADFLTRASDEIINQASKWQSLSGGTISLPMTLRLSVGRSYGGQHSQDLSGMIARVNGLKVYYPTTPTDMLATLRYAISSKDPVIIFEPKEFYGKTEITKAIPQNENALESTSIKQAGDNATVVTIGPALYDALEANKDGNLGLEIISLVSLAPIDYNPIIASVKKTGKLIIMGESSFTGGIMTDVCAFMQKACFNYLKAPVEILSTFPTIVPPNGVESGYYDLKERLLALL